METGDEVPHRRDGQRGAPTSGCTPAIPGLPDADRLLRLVHEGRSFEDIHDLCRRAMGTWLSESSLVLALGEVVLRTSPSRHSYWDYLPWRVHECHRQSAPLQLLRHLGRRDLGAPLPARVDETLRVWREVLARERLVVAYVPSTGEGFWYVDESLRSGPRVDLPLCVRPLTWAPAGARAELEPPSASR
jgi:hypothetical protein